MQFSLVRSIVFASIGNPERGGYFVSHFWMTTYQDVFGRQLKQNLTYRKLLIVAVLIVFMTMLKY